MRSLRLGSASRGPLLRIVDVLHMVPHCSHDYERNGYPDPWCPVQAWYLTSLLKGHLTTCTNPCRAILGFNAHSA